MNISDLDEASPKPEADDMMQLMYPKRRRAVLTTTTPSRADV